MDRVLEVGDEVFVRSDGRRAIITYIGKHLCLYELDGKHTVSRHEFIPVKWDDDKVGNTGIGVCAKNGSDG